MAPSIQADDFVDKTIEFPGDISFERLRPLTDLRRDSEEARILYTCRRISDWENGAGSDEEYVMKVKIQVPKPNGTRLPLRGPSEQTSAELEALEKFNESGLTSVPHLVTTTLMVQNENGPLPGGYISAIVMTKMTGQSIWDLKFWSMNEEERVEIRQKFLQVLKSIWMLGIGPYDCALRNVLWDRDSSRCSIIDFEHWRPYDPETMVSEVEEIKELQRWGIVQRPPPTSWAQEWGLR